MPEHTDAAELSRLPLKAPRPQPPLPLLPKYPRQRSDLEKPCASMIASVQPPGDAASSSSARRRSAWGGGEVAALGEDSTAGRPKGAVGRDAVPGSAVADRRVPRTGWSYSPISRMRVETHC